MAAKVPRTGVVFWLRKWLHFWLQLGRNAHFSSSEQNEVLNSVKRHFFREKMSTFAKYLFLI